MQPLVLQDDDHGEILGVNVVDINPAHQLLAFGVDGNGTVQFWDPRSRSNVGILRLPASRLMPLSAMNDGAPLSVTAISSRHDGLSYAIGTSTGHTLLYDIRAANPFAMKDQGYGLPIKDTIWIEGGNRMAGDGLVLSADKKVIKIWDRNTVRSTFFHSFFAVCSVPCSAFLQLRLDYSSQRCQQRSPPPGQRYIVHGKRRHPDVHVLYSATWPCTTVGQFPRKHHGRDGRPNHSFRVRGLQVRFSRRTQDVRCPPSSSYPCT
jgi:WD40 repeat protein